MRRWIITLISPQESGNVGAAARVLKNFGAGGLRIVAPRCEVFCPESRAFASGASEVLRAAEIFDTLKDALADRELSVGLTGIGGKHHRVDCVGLLPGELIAERDHLTKCALVFGREERGMESEELEACDFLWSLPTQPKFPSLNLAQAIAVSLSALSEAERLRGLSEVGKGLMPTEKGLGPLAGSTAKEDQPATNQDLEILLDHFRRLMERTGWDEGRRTIDALSGIRDLVVRGRITKREINLLHGVCKQSLLAVNRPELFEKFRKKEE